MSGMIAVKDLEQLAKENIPYDSYKYFAYGAGEETTLKENLEAFHRSVQMTSLDLDMIQ